MANSGGASARWAGSQDGGATAVTGGNGPTTGFNGIRLGHTRRGGVQNDFAAMTVRKLQVWLAAASDADLRRYSRGAP
jgi:hypothetical protein